MSNITVPENENIFSKLKNIQFTYVVFGIIIFLIILLCVLVYYYVNYNKKSNSSSGPNSSSTSKSGDIKQIFLIMLFLMIVFGLCLVLLPNAKDIKKLFLQIKNVFYAIIYTIGIILFFHFFSDGILKNYPYLTVPVIVCLGIFCFYKSYSHSYIEEFDVNYERIKSIILFICLIATFIIFYQNDPGGYIKKYFGTSFMLAILIGVFSLLYLIIVIMLPDNGSKSSETNLIKQKFSTFSIVMNTSFVFFLIFIFLLGFFDKKGGKPNESSTQAFIRLISIILILVILIMWSVLISVNTFPEIINKNKDSSSLLDKIKRVLLSVFAIIVSILFILWISTTIENFSDRRSTISFVLNIIIIIIVLGLVYKTINIVPQENTKNKNFFNLVLSVLFYVPCFFIGVFDNIGKIVSGSPDKNNLSGSILMFIVSILLFVIYFNMPSFFNIINKQGGNQLVNRPVNTNTRYALGTYADLNKSEQFDYQYAISFWVFINSAPPNLNPNYNNFVSILNFGGKPNILYNGKNNTLMITVATEGKQDVTKNKNFKLVDYDEEGNRIIYINNNFLLQKWNNIIVNYSGGVLDIFLNGELVKSNPGIVPYYKLDNLTIGTDGGIEGGICNVVYFRKPLTTTNIFYLYKMIKDRSPPVMNDSNKTILVNNINKSVSSIT